MNKPVVFFTFCALLLLAACHGRRPDSPSKPLPGSPVAQTAPEIQAVSPAPLVNTQPTKAPQKRPADVVMPAIATDSQPQAAPQPGVTPKPEPAATAPAVSFPQSLPAFEDEENIDLQGRLLSSYAYLAPRPDDSTYQVPWKGEQLKFGVYYAFIKAGNAYIKNRGLVSINGRDAYVIETTAFSASVIDAIFKVRDINLSWLDAQNFYSLGYVQSVREGSYKRDEWVHFDYDTHTYNGQLQKKEAPRPVQGVLTGPVLDMLTSLYFIRAQQLIPGTDIVLDIVNREKTYPLLVKVLKKEKVKTAAGTFDTILVEPQLRGEGIFIQKGKSLKVWLTDDAYKMPVKMKTEVFIGSVSAELLEYKRN